MACTIFHEFWPIAVQPFPFLVAPHALIGHAIRAEFVLSDPGLDVSQPPTEGRVINSIPLWQLIGIPCVSAVVRSRTVGKRRLIHRPPQRTMLDGCPPCGDQRLEFLLGNAHSPTLP